VNDTPARRLPAATLLLLALLGASALQAHTGEEAPPMALRGAMQKLGQDMQAVTGAIAVEDWAKVAELAPGIADHAEPPPAEKVRIITWLGADAGRFRGFDAEAHEAATAMGAAAARGDGTAVIAAFARVQAGCLGCHQGFRKAFIGHFYGQH